MNKLVLNIPYSSLNLPNSFFEHTLISPELINAYNLNECELYIDRIFGKNTFPKIIAPYSKIVCDTLNLNNFEDKTNFDFISTKTHKNKTFIKPTQEYKSYILNEYYKPLHNRIEQSLAKQCAKDSTIFIDCHSHKNLNNEKIADVCISYDDQYKNIRLIEFIKAYFEKLNYSVDINNFNKGTFIPNAFKQNPTVNLNCVRLSINQDLYLSFGEPRQNFKKVQKHVQELLKVLKTTDF